jgi:hypothetical protein
MQAVPKDLWGAWETCRRELEADIAGESKQKRSTSDIRNEHENTNGPCAPHAFRTVQKRAVKSVPVFIRGKTCV